MSTAEACLQELIDIISEAGCLYCPFDDYDCTGTQRCEIREESERPCRMGWRAWLERRIANRGAST